MSDAPRVCSGSAPIAAAAAVTPASLSGKPPRLELHHTPASRGHAAAPNRAESLRLQPGGGPEISTARDRGGLRLGGDACSKFVFWGLIVSARKAPSGLGNAGRAMWKSIHDALGDEFELDDRERQILTLACRQRDDLAALEATLRKDGRTVRGSVGQPRLHPAVAEARQARLAIARLLGQLALPDDAGEMQTSASLRASKAAHAMHDQLRDRRAQRTKGDRG